MLLLTTFELGIYNFKLQLAHQLAYYIRIYKKRILVPSHTISLSFGKNQKKKTKNG